MIYLSKRLKCIADWVPQDSTLVDIGTDHAQLPVYLLLTRKIVKAIACDKSEGPLLRAQSNKEKNRISDDMLQLLHSDGLKQVNLQESHVICIAGMGGKTMADILTSPKLTKRNRIIVQPNCDVIHLRTFLSNNGWVIIDEKMIKERGHFYPTMMVVFGQQDISPEQAYLGPVLMQKRSPEWLLWLHRENTILNKVAVQSKEKMPQEKQLRWAWIKKHLSC